MTLRQVGNYRLESLLGVGGMGDVYKAYDTHRDRYVALKLLPEALSSDQEYLARFRRESNVAARLRDPHVIPIHDFGEIDGQLFIDMRLVDGADIGTLLATNGRIAPQRATYLISQVAEALDAAHADQLVHRDIKPSNILVTLSDFVYVVDFGIARLIGSRQTPLTNTGVTIGTLHYMAPERFIGHDIDGRADIYSLACLLHECLTGAPPFGDRDLPALMYAQLYSDPPEASSLVEGIPPALDAVIARGMAKDPKDRFATAGALAAAARTALLDRGAGSANDRSAASYTSRNSSSGPRSRAARGAGFANGGSAASHIDRNTGSNAPGRDDRRPAWRGRAARPRTGRPRHGRPLPPDGNGGCRPRRRSGRHTATREQAPRQQSQSSGSGPPSGGAPEGPARRPGWRRLGVPILAGAVALAVAIVLIVVAASPRTKRAALLLRRAQAAGLASPFPRWRGDTGRAEPQLRRGRAERQVRLHHQRRGEGDHGARHRH